MRKIKFRAWDEEESVMIDGDSLAFEEYAPLANLLSQKGIMQFTGLYDKNGKEIYEWDFVRVKGRIFKIKYLEYTGGYQVLDGLNYYCTQLNSDTAKLYEVVGNAYEGMKEEA